jgi:hypothetical protein
LVSGSKHLPFIILFVRRFIRRICLFSTHLPLGNAAGERSAVVSLLLMRLASERSGCRISCHTENRLSIRTVKAHEGACVRSRPGSFACLLVPTLRNRRNLPFLHRAVAALYVSPAASKEIGVPQLFCEVLARTIVFPPPFLFNTTLLPLIKPLIILVFLARLDLHYFQYCFSNY